MNYFIKKIWRLNLFVLKYDKLISSVIIIITVGLGLWQLFELNKQNRLIANQLKQSEEQDRMVSQQLKLSRDQNIIFNNQLEESRKFRETISKRNMEALRYEIYLQSVISKENESNIRPYGIIRTMMPGFARNNINKNIFLSVWNKMCIVNFGRGVLTYVGTITYPSSGQLDFYMQLEKNMLNNNNIDFDLCHPAERLTTVLFGDSLNVNTKFKQIKYNLNSYLWLYSLIIYQDQEGTYYCTLHCDTFRTNDNRIALNDTSGFNYDYNHSEMYRKLTKKQIEVLYSIADTNKHPLAKYLIDITPKLMQ